jgi:hypothetical protein
MFVAAYCPVTPYESKESPEPAANKPAPEDCLLPVGSLVEISGPEAHIQAARILAKNPSLPAAWIEQNLELLPEEIFGIPMDFKKTLFVNGRRDSYWAASSLITSGLFPLLVFHAPYENERLLRRLRRQAIASRATVLLLRDAPCFSWTIRVQLRALQGGLEVLRWRKQ